MRARYCPACGGPLQKRHLQPDEPARDVCTRCGRIHFRNAKPTASALVVRDGRVLLVQRAIEPARGAWDIPGGFLEVDEHPEAGTVRELREETGLAITIIGLLGIYLDRYGSAGDADTTLNIVYLAMAQGDPRAADDAATIGWFAPAELPETFAFEHMRAALADWCRLQETKQIP